MSDLPDLDTSRISYLRYWNAIDQGGVSSIDPEEVVSQSNVESYTLYDNGVTGYITLPTGRTAEFRVKNDGWFVVYLDRTRNFVQHASDPSNARGTWDIANNWTDSTSNEALSSGGSLITRLNDLAQELSNYGSITYTAADVGLYNYEYTDATNLTLFSQIDTGNSGKTVTTGFIRTSGTTRSEHVMWCAGIDLQYYSLYVTNDDSGNEWHGTSDTAYTTYDALAGGDFPNADYEYTVTAQQVDDINYNSDEQFGHGHMTLWG